MAGAIRIGVLRDVPTPRGPHDFGMNGMRLAIDAVNAQGGIHGRSVELVEKLVEGRDAGSHENVAATISAWREISSDESVLMLIGPSTTPCAIALHPLIEALAMPTIHWAGTNEACGPWMFQFQAGYFPDEGPALAYLLAHQRLTSVACFRGEGAYGMAYLAPFIRTARALGIEIAAEIPIDKSTNLDAAVAAARASNAKAVVAMGLFNLGVKLAETMKQQHIDVPKFGNCGFALAAGRDAAVRETLQGWIATDMLDPCNLVATHLFNDYAVQHGVRPTTASACFGYDLARLSIEGIRLATELTRSGVREGLERVKDLASATGGAGSSMSYGPHDRLALKGPRLFVFTQIDRDGLKLLNA